MYKRQDEVNANLADVLHDVEKKAQVSLDGAVEYLSLIHIYRPNKGKDKSLYAGMVELLRNSGHEEQHHKPE